MSTQAQLKTRGILLILSFFIVLVVIFLPIFPGVHGEKTNGLNYLDNFFNQLSKGSANYIKEQEKKAEQYKGEAFDMSLKLKDLKSEKGEILIRAEQQAEAAAKVFAANGVNASAEEATLKLSGQDLGGMITAILGDSQAMYENQGAALQAKYGVDAKLAFYSCYQSLTAMEKDQTSKGKFDQAKFIKGVQSKAMEPAYNYYGVEAKSVKAEVILLIGSLAFYVIYTVWYGFGLLFLFEGMGIKLEH